MSLPDGARRRQPQCPTDLRADHDVSSRALKRCGCAYCASLLEERQDWAEIERIAKRIAAMPAVARQWHIGDGYGGGVRAVLDEAFLAARLPQGPRGRGR